MTYYQHEHNPIYSSSPKHDYAVNYSSKFSSPIYSSGEPVTAAAAPPPTQSSSIPIFNSPTYQQQNQNPNPRNDIVYGYTTNVSMSSPSARCGSPIRFCYSDSFYRFRFAQPHEPHADSTNRALSFQASRTATSGGIYAQPKHLTKMSSFRNASPSKCAVPRGRELPFELGPIMIVRE